MNARALALIAATGASTIYGINHTVAKGLMPHVIEPFGFILLRVGGAALLFWMAGSFFPSEKVTKKDLLRFALCALFGMVLNMNMFFKGLQLSTPVNSSVIITIAPVLLLILTSIFLKEKITFLKITGILLGLAGVLALILFGEKTQPNAPNIPLGNFFFIINAASYSVYLILVKPLVVKYSSITLMKFLFLFALLMNLPIGIQEFSEVQWSMLQLSEILQMVYVVVGTTFLTYLLNIYALKQLSPSIIGAFMYLQPVVATLFALLVGVDSLTPLRIIAAALIFLGVYLTTLKSKKAL